jgi:hypothetical protein
LLLQHPGAGVDVLHRRAATDTGALRHSVTHVTCRTADLACVLTVLSVVGQHPCTASNGNHTAVHLRAVVSMQW